MRNKKLLSDVLYRACFSETRLVRARVADVHSMVSGSALIAFVQCTISHLFCGQLARKNFLVSRNYAETDRPKKERSSSFRGNDTIDLSWSKISPHNLQSFLIRILAKVIEIVVQEFSGHKREVTSQKNSDAADIIVICCPLPREYLCFMQRNEVEPRF